MGAPKDFEDFETSIADFETRTSPLTNFQPPLSNFQPSMQPPNDSQGGNIFTVTALCDIYPDTKAPLV